MPTVSPSDAALHELSVTLRTVRAGLDAHTAQLAADTHSRQALARHNREAARYTAGSRVFAAAVIVAGLWGVMASVNDSAATGKDNLKIVATHHDADCVRSDLAVYLAGAVPDPACGPPPGGRR